MATSNEVGSGENTIVAPSPLVAASSRAASTSVGNSSVALATAPGREESAYVPASAPNRIVMASNVSINVVPRLP
jgi:hypothetical protein